MSTDALILELSTGLTPVRRRNVRREGLALLALIALELLLVVALGMTRPDIAEMILSPYLVWKLGSLALLAMASAAVALTSFSPHSSTRRGLTTLSCLFSLAIIAGALITSSTQSARGFVERLEPVHGMMCMAAIIVLTLPIMVALTILMRRGAPMNAKQSATAAGLAGATGGAFVFAFCCPMNDPLYIITWYLLAIATVAVSARWLLPRRFRL